jgi:hypothetical protein
VSPRAWSVGVGAAGALLLLVLIAGVHALVVVDEPSDAQVFAATPTTDVAPTTGVGAAPSTTAPAPSTTAPAPTTTAPAPTTTAAPTIVAPTTTAPPAPTTASPPIGAPSDAVTLINVYTQDGIELATVQAGATTYVVGAGDPFGADLRIDSISGQCAQFHRGATPFSLCVGQTSQG